MTKDDINKSTLNPYALSILENWGSEDAHLWVRTLTANGLPDNISFESAQEEAQKSFSGNVGDNTFLTFDSLNHENNFNEARDYYINFFIKTAAHYLNELRSTRKKQEDEFNKKMKDFSLLGHAAAARWFAMMESSETMKNITPADLRTIAKSVFDCKFDKYRVDNRLYQVFISFFTKEAQMLVDSLKCENS